MRSGVQAPDGRPLDDEFRRVAKILLRAGPPHYHISFQILFTIKVLEIKDLPAEQCVSYLLQSLYNLEDSQFLLSVRPRGFWHIRWSRFITGNHQITEIFS